LYKRTNLLKISTCFILLFFSQFVLAQQRPTVGVVLSGGGASGVAHVGVLKALEENHIPIDYIVGTSAGALVGAMYASGYSPDEIEAYVLSEAFQLMAKGQ
jgi:NTE family protein